MDKMWNLEISFPEILLVEENLIHILMKNVTIFQIFKKNNSTLDYKHESV